MVCASSVNYPVKFGLFPKHFKVSFARARKPIHLVVHLANPNSPFFDMILIGVELHFCQREEKGLTVGSRNVIYFPPNVFSIVLSEYFFA